METVKVIVTKVVQTCHACPAQWNAETSTGDHLYVRYRWGWLQIGAGPTHEAAVTAAMEMGGPGVTLVSRQLNADQYDGYLSYGRLKDATHDLIAWPEEGEDG